MLKTLVIFGASGDLTARFLMPAIVRLHQAGQLPEKLRISDWRATHGIRRRFGNRRKQSLESSPRPACVLRVRPYEYRRVDVTDGRQVAEAVAHLTAPLLAYLTLPPALFKSAVGMEPLHALNERTLRDRKVDVLRAVRRLTPEAVAEQTIRARYGRGAIGGQEVLPYTKEPGVAPDRRVETFAQVALWIDNWRWAGVPFVLGTGKALRRDRREIASHSSPSLISPSDNARSLNRIS